HRQPDAAGDPADLQATASAAGSDVSDRSTALAFPPIDRLFNYGEPRDSRLCIQTQGSDPLQPVLDGKEFDRAGEPKLMDDESAQARGHRSCSQRGAPADGEWTAWRRRPARRQFDG